MKNKLIFLAAILFAAQSLYATIEKTGTINSNETWSDDTVKVTGDITINNGVTLTIDPGVYVEFQGYYSINIQGQILAQGTTSDSIKFDILPDSLEVGWKGISFNNTPTTNDSSKLEYCIFLNSKRNNKGGTFYIYKFSKVIFTHTQFRNNNVVNSSSYQGGGALFCDHSNITIQNCYFYNNGANTTSWGSRGGAIYSYYSSLKIKNCTFKKNGAGLSQGGAIAFTSGSGLIVNCLFNENESSTGGGAIFGDYSFSGKIINSTFINNQTGSGGNFGGSIIYIRGTYGRCNIDIINSILWHNTNEQVFIEKSNASIQFSCVEDGKSSIRGYTDAELDYGINNLSTDPEFKDYSANLFELESSSLLINAGTPDTTSLGIPDFDLNDSARISSDRIDMGAYEFQLEPDPRIIINNDMTNEFVRYDSLFLEELFVLSYPDGYTYTFLNKPEGMTIKNDSIKWIPTKDQASKLYNISLKVENSQISDTLNFNIYVLDNNEFAELESTDTIWDYDTIKVFNTLTVKNGKTLFIKPGTYIEFQGHYKLNIQGRILAEGKKDSIITFTAKDTVLTETSGGWHGIRFKNTPASNDTSILNYCNIKNGNAFSTTGDYHEDRGGAIYVDYYSKVKILNSIIQNNKAIEYGGAIYCSSSSPLLVNNLIIKNNAAWGGAISCSYNSQLKIYNNTIADNNSGIYTFNASPVLKNTILWNRKNYEVYGYLSSKASLVYCNAEGTVFSGAGNISIDPIFENSGLNDYSLNDMSPCINSGNPEWTNDSLYLQSDIENNPRIKFERIDIGAFEYQEYISPRGVEISNDTIKEHSKDSLFVGVLSTIHPYPTENYSYSFNNDSVNEDSLNFYISNDSLFTAVDNYNYENKNLYKLFIKTIDDNGKEYTELIEISIKDVNDPPTGITLSNNQINENIGIGAEVGNLSTVDEDISDQFLYSFTVGDGINDVDNNYFLITNNKLIVNNKLNFEEKKQLNIVVRSTDNEGLHTDQAFVIYVNDLQEFGINPFQSTARTGAVTFVIDSSIYAGLGNNADSVMCNFWKYNLKTDLWTEISKFPGAPRSEAVSFVINGKAYVGLGRSAYPYTFYKDFYKYDPATDQWHPIADFGGTARYNAVAFAIDSEGYVGTGKNVSGEQKDFWKYNHELDTWTQVADVSGDKRHGATAFVINGKAYVSGGQYFDSYSVQLSDVQEYNPVTDTWAEKIFSDGTNLSFTDAASFVMGNKGYICYGNKQCIVSYNPETNEVINYGDVLGLENNRFDPVAFLLDSTAYFGLGNYGVFDPVYQNDILKLNHLPTNITLSNNNLNENMSPATVVGLLYTPDKDNSDSHAYMLVVGNGLNDADNSSFTISGNQLITNTVFDYETKNQYYIYIQTEDGLGATFKKEFIITVNDINEMPTDILLSVDTINENSAATTVVGEFSTVDEDEGNTHSYTFDIGNGLNDADNNYFTVSGSELRSNSIFNYENKDHYYIYVKTEDQGGESFSKAFVVTVINVNDDPTDIQISENTIDENSSEGTVVGVLSTVDEDYRDSHVYSLVTGNGVNDSGNSSFTIVGNELQNTKVFDFETQDEYFIFVETNDDNGGVLQKAFVITINDVTEVGIQELLQSNIKVFPNPTCGLIFVDLSEKDFKNITVKVINSHGRVIYKAKNNEPLVKIDLTGNATGVYYILLENDDFKGLQRIILK